MAQPTVLRPGEHTIYNALELCAAKRPCGLFFDFDGVLSFIQGEPDSAHPVSGVVEQLARLVPLVGKVAIVSARPVQVLARHFGKLRSVSLFGMYGLEEIRDGVASTNPAAEDWVPTIRQLITEAADDLPGGIYVEDKRLSVSLHFRRHPECGGEAEEWAHAKAAQYGLTEQRGRMVVELKPPVPVNKGTVLMGETSDLRSAWYFGDDISDAKGFDALRRRHEQDHGFLGICVAVRNNETGQVLEEQADYTLDSPGVMPDLLAAAVEIFSRAGRA